MTGGRPVVVLAGWLGCQPRYLKVYEKAYRKMGFHVISIIAAPSLVVEATLRYEKQREAMMIPSQWPCTRGTSNHGSNNDTTAASMMHELAWNVLGQVHRSKPSLWMYHAFSNGGCFLWEHVRRILDLSQTNPKENSLPSPSKLMLASLYDRAQGVVFDSCPAWFGGEHNDNDYKNKSNKTNREDDDVLKRGQHASTLRAALHYCTKREKVQLLWQYGPRPFLYPGPAEQNGTTQRCHDFWEYLKNDPLGIHQLYLYSVNDPLSQHQSIDRLYEYRKQKASLITNNTDTQQPMVFRKRWDESLHCAHLRQHPQEYINALQTFVQAVCLQSKL